MMPDSAIQIVITVEEGQVNSVFSTVPAQITLVDFDLIDQGGDIETWYFDAADVEHDIAETLATAQAAVGEAREAAEEIAEAERKSKYLSNGGGQCPYCGSSDLKPAGIEAGAGQLAQPIQCAGCGRNWANLYKLVELTEIGQGDSPEIK
jgi:hypothetical protein